jgi:hypothetical protein
VGLGGRLNEGLVEECWTNLLVGDDELCLDTPALERRRVVLCLSDAGHRLYRAALLLYRFI